MYTEGNHLLTEHRKTKIVEARFDCWGEIEVPEGLTSEEETDLLFEALKAGTLHIKYPTLKEKHDKGGD